jgi:hypothetical protein
MAGTTIAVFIPGSEEGAVVCPGTLSGIVDRDQWRGRAVEGTAVIGIACIEMAVGTPLCIC